MLLITSCAGVSGSGWPFTSAAARVNASGGLTPVTLPGGKQTKVPILPVEMDGQRFGTRLNIPRAGEHTRELLAGLGYDQAEIDTLVSERVVAVG